LTLFAAASNSSLNAVEPGVLGFLVVAGIGVALVFLLRSMNKQFKKIPPPEDSGEPEEPNQAKSHETPTAAEATEAEGAKRG
jgi:hypothetical protein